MKTVTVPLYFIRHGKVGGVENAAYNLVTGLSACDAEVLLPVASESELDSGFVEFSRSRPNIRFETGNVISPALRRLATSRFTRFAEEFAYARNAPGTSDATVFPNYFTPPSDGRKTGTRICIIHDLQHRHMPQFFPRSKRIWLEIALRSTFRYADRIVFISQASLDDARNFYGKYADDRWTVIPNAVSWDDFGEPDAVSPFEFPYILSVAHHFPHKNIETLVRAFARIAGQIPEHHLVLAGQMRAAFASSSTGYAITLEELAASLGIADRVHLTGFVSRQRLGTLYKHTSCFAFPSLFEGFGLPPIEAMGFGARCVVSDIPALREVTMGLAGMVTEPRSVEAWAEALLGRLDCDVSDQREFVMARYYPKSIAERILQI